LYLRRASRSRDYITGRGDPSILGERHVSPISPESTLRAGGSYTAPAQSGSSLVVGVRTSYLAPGTDLQSSSSLLPLPLSLSLCLSIAAQSSIKDSSSWQVAGRGGESIFERRPPFSMEI